MKCSVSGSLDVLSSLNYKVEVGDDEASTPEWYSEKESMESLAVQRETLVYQSDVQFESSAVVYPSEILVLNVESYYTNR